MSKAARARENLAAANLSDLVDIREGDALETFARDLPQSIDIVLPDGAKDLYPSILSLLEDRLRVGALVVADNADASPDYLAWVRSIERGYFSVPFAEDVELSMRIGNARRTRSGEAQRTRHDAMSLAPDLTWSTGRDRGAPSGYVSATCGQTPNASLHLWGRCRRQVPQFCIFRLGFLDGGFSRGQGRLLCSKHSEKSGRDRGHLDR